MSLWIPCFVLRFTNKNKVLSKATESKKMWVHGSWKQGDDLYGAFDNRVAVGFEYTAKYNLGEQVDYEPVPDLFGKNLYTVISEKGRGNLRPVFEKIYHHYHDRKGLEMKYTKMLLDKIRPEGFHWDHSSFGTLFYHQIPVLK